ncbi:MAG TPA: nuclear transport factor 2 family protein [Sphingomicrobium sp.]|nr:nuclear transport factor 2 family protein [Sphingomicrobium sp.]
MHSTRDAVVAALLMMAAPLSAHEAAPKATQITSLPPAARAPAATVDAFHAALRRGDTRAASTLLSEDALIFEAGGAERTKAEYSAHHLPADAEFARSVSSVLTRRYGAANEELAWIASEGRTSGTYKGKPLDLQTTETMLLRHDASGWRIVHVHWSSAKR